MPGVESPEEIADEHDARGYARYMTGSGRFIRMAREIFNARLGATQAEILRAAADNRRVLIVSGNGVGKSYAVALLILCFLYSTPDSIVLLTSGTYSILSDTTWKPMKEQFRQADLVGVTLDNPPRLHTNMGEEWFFKAISPVNPGSLEGRHASDIMVVIEEADKPEITAEHFDSAGSSVTDANDRMIAVANPPSDESNIVYEKMNDDRWHVVQFSSFESHNVQVDAGTIDADPIPGLVDLPTVAEDYEAWNGERWPGKPDDWPSVATCVDRVESGDMSRAELVEGLRDGLSSPRLHEDGHDVRWYRRRLGEMPPDDSTAPRPWTVADVDAACQRYRDAHESVHRDAIGVDVARGGGDRTVVAEMCDECLVVTVAEHGVDHTENEELVTDRINASPVNGPIAIDAVGEGSALADRIRQVHADHRVKRFNAGAGADDDENYSDARTEALEMLGRWLRDGGAVRPDSDLAAELRAHARHCRYHEKTLKAATVYQATPKDEIKDALGKSPDMVDAAAIAAWAEGGFGLNEKVLGAFGRRYH